MAAAPSPDLGDLIAARAGEAMELNQRYLNRQLGRVVKTLGFDREWVHGRGEFLIDAAGERYLDLYAGYGVFSLGRNHPVVRDQLMSVMAAEPANLPQIGVTTLAGVLAEALVRRAPDPIDACVLNSSGTEAVETALKLARATTGRSRVLHCERAFHGLTLGSLSVNGNAEFRDRFGALLPGFAAVPFGDLKALEAALAGGDVAAFIVEPVQGKGVFVAPDGYLAAVGELCRAAGTLLIIDEVQSGLGRTGTFLCLEHWPDVRPDMVTLSKALSGGFVPVGATLCSRAVFERTFDSMENSVVHGSTFGNNDFAAAAALATLQVLDDERLVERARELGELLMTLTVPLVEKYEVVREVRGLGLMWGIELGPPAGRTARRLWEAIERRQPGMFAQMITVPLFHEHRILTQVAGHHMNVIKALPPLVISEGELRRFVAALDAVLGEAQDHLVRSYASLGVGLGRRTLSAR
ncbi:MAG TPA: aspartate aminotransferase family protein [Solirubrobacteraceae bacterium]|nr:aspartate aminotransferase family protein [Solirubrobacteraceae bacterium]